MSETTSLCLPIAPSGVAPNSDPSCNDPPARSQHVLYSTLSPESIEDIVNSHYSLDGLIDCVLYHRGVNDTYLVTTSSLRYAFRLYRSNWRTREAILAELNAITHVHSQGAAVTLPLARRDGGLITELQAPEGLRRAVMFNWAEGKPPRYADSLQSILFGHALAELHTAGDQLRADPTRPTINTDYLFRRSVQTAMTQLVHIPHAARRLTGLAERITKEVQRAENSLSDWGFCHGDLWVENAHVTDGHIVMFDFDFCGFGWRLIDLATYSFDARQRGATEAVRRSFIDGYLQIRPEGKQSVEFLGLFAILVGLHTIATMVTLSKEMGSRVASDEFVDRMLADCESIEIEVRQGRYDC